MNSLRVIYLLSLADRYLRQHKPFSLARTVYVGGGRKMDLKATSMYMTEEDVAKVGLTLDELTAHKPGPGQDSWFDWALDTLMQLWDDFENKGQLEPITYAQANMLVKDNPNTETNESRYLVTQFTVDIW